VPAARNALAAAPSRRGTIAASGDLQGDEGGADQRRHDKPAHEQPAQFQRLACAERLRREGDPCSCAGRANSQNRQSKITEAMADARRAGWRRRAGRSDRIVETDADQRRGQVRQPSPDLRWRTPARS